VKNNNQTRFKLKNAVLASAIVAISGCASTGGERVLNEKPTLDSMKYLEEIAVEARHELRLLAKMKEAQTMEVMTEEQHKQRAFQALVVPHGFEKRVDLDVEGMSESVAAAVAKMAGYEFEIVGDSDGHDVFVDIEFKNKPLNEALRELGAQTGDFVTIEIDQNSSKMFYNYTGRRLLSDMPSKWGQ